MKRHMPTAAQLMPVKIARTPTTCTKKNGIAPTQSISSPRFKCQEILWIKDLFLTSTVCITITPHNFFMERDRLTPIETNFKRGPKSLHGRGHSPKKDTPCQGRVHSNCINYTSDSA